MKQGFVLTYSIRDEDSFKKIPIIRDRILSVKDLDDLPAILVGKDVQLEDERVISTEQGRSLAKKFGCPFLELSTGDRDDVRFALMMIVDEIFKMRYKYKAKQRNHWLSFRPRSTTPSPVFPRPLNLFLILSGVDQAAARYSLVIFLCDGLLRINKHQILQYCGATAYGPSNVIMSAGIEVPVKKRHFR